MAVAELIRRESFIPGWEYEETIANGQTGDTIKLHPIPEDKHVTCAVIAGAGTGKIQFSTSLDSKVAAETALWQDWPLGDVTGSEYDSLVGPATGLRGVSISGEITIEIVA